MSEQRAIGVSRHRLRTVAKLCQSTTRAMVRHAGRAVPGREESRQLAKRKRRLARRSGPGHTVEEPGKTLHYLGFLCGKKWHDSSTTLILAFLTRLPPRVDTRLPRPWERDPTSPAVSPDGRTALRSRAKRCPGGGSRPFPQMWMGLWTTSFGREWSW
jgi:hypothetical protein